MATIKFNVLCEKAQYEGPKALSEVVVALATFFPEIHTWAIDPKGVDFEALDKALFGAWKCQDKDARRDKVRQAILAIWGHAP